MLAALYLTSEEIIARLRAGVQKGTVQDALRLFGAGGAPRPGPVGLRAGQLDLDATGHPAKLSESATRSHSDPSL